MTRNRQRCMLPPDGANTPASRIFRINSSGTGSGFNRRIDRVVAMISNRSEVSSGIAILVSVGLGAHAGPRGCLLREPTNRGCLFGAFYAQVMFGRGLECRRMRRLAGIISA